MTEPGSVRPAWPGAAAFAILGVLVAAISLGDRGLMLDAFVHGSYFALLAGVLLWIAVLARAWRGQRRAVAAALQRHRNGLLFCLLVCIALAVAVPAGFRVLADETNIVAVSRALAIDKRADNVIEGYQYYGNFQPERRVSGKRPLLLQFLTATVHSLTGYRIGNVFVVNFLALFVTLATCYLAVARFLGPRWAPVAILLVASQPQLAMSANSAALEPLFLALLSLTLASLYWHLRRPSDDSQLLLWIHAVLLLGTRYEALLPAAMLGTFILATRRVDAPALLRDRWFYAATPWLLLPLFWQRLLRIGDGEFPGGTVSAAFSVDNALEHAYLYLKHFSQFGLELPFATAVELAGLLALGVFAVLFVARRAGGDRIDRLFVAVTASILLALWLLIVSYYFGRIEHPSSSRLFLPFSIALSLAATWAMARHRLLRERPAAALLLALAAVVVYLPVAVEDRFSNRQFLVREYRFAADFLADRDKNLLFIHDRPGMFTIHEVGAINFIRANRETATLQERYRNRLFSDIFVLQRIEYTSGEAQEATRLDPAYRLETLVERQNGSNVLLRISRVVPPT